MIQDFRKRSGFQEGMYRNIQGNSRKREIKSLYLRIEETFYHLCPERERNSDTTITVPIDRALKDLLPEMGYQ